LNELCGKALHHQSSASCLRGKSFSGAASLALVFGCAGRTPCDSVQHLWCGFAIFWESMVIRKGAPVSMMLWGIPFVLSGVLCVRPFHCRRNGQKEDFTA
jgi:hypothetical protein